ncbi:hypothetical protein ALMP_18860 [Streptomyces sp. A012304]|nr:hypothetical protein ALMP_18860 [Streptomyces sp. A012304]
MVPAAGFATTSTLRTRASDSSVMDILRKRADRTAHEPYGTNERRGQDSNLRGRGNHPTGKTRPPINHSGHLSKRRGQDSNLRRRAKPPDRENPAPDQPLRAPLH